ncbi:Do family serine endopeptidase [bacterium]|nr:Do family serine endopeptidase [bacterium]
MNRWLIIEDDFGLSETLATAFIKYGFEVGIVRLGQDGIDSMDQNFDGAIIDLNLPDIDGESVIKILRKKFPDKKFGIITGEPFENLEKIAKRCEADFWIRKPFTLQELFNFINNSHSIKNENSIEKKKIKTGGLKMMRKIGILPVILAGIIIGIILTANLNLVHSANAESIESKIPEVSRLFADVAEQTMPSVITITSARTYNVPVRTFNPFAGNGAFDFFFGPGGHPQYRNRQFKQEGLGSGVIVSDDGYILTNNHVVDGADEVQVHIADETYDAQIIGKDDKTDIAVLKIDVDKKLPAAKLGNSDKIRIGEWVLAIGSPFKLEHTVTAGIISAKGRSKMGITDYEDFIQTDASINPGNSGGALVNLDGKIIGINTAIVSQSGGNVGIGFAIPINLAKQIMNQLIDNGKVVRGWLGVSIQDVTEDIADALGLDDAKGVIVSSVIPNSPADDAGLQRGDVILAIDGENVNDAGELRNKIASLEPETKIKLKIVGNGKKIIKKVELGEMPGEEGIVASVDNNNDINLGLHIKSLSLSDARKLNFDGDGVLVVDVDDGSIADKAGIHPEDIIVEMNRIPISNPQNIRDALKNIQKNSPMLFVVYRNGYTIYLASKA